jgi:hypothetical protein
VQAAGMLVENGFAARFSRRLSGWHGDCSIYIKSKTHPYGEPS